MNKNTKIQSGVLVLIILLVAFSRLLPLPLNFSPLAAISLFGAAHFTNRWKAFLVPIIVTWLSDLFIINTVYAYYYSEFIWFYSGFYWQHGSYAAIVLFGIFLYAKNISVFKVTSGALGSGIIFFLISNFGVWVSTTTYSPDLSGLIACYVAGIPFYKGTLLGDLCYSMLLFGGYYLMQRRFAILEPQRLKYV